MRIIFPRMETTHFHNAYDGGCKFVQLLGEELVKKGHEVEIVTTRLRDNPDLNYAVYNGVKHVFIAPEYTGKRLIPFNMIYKLLFSYHLNNYLKKQKFDILHNSEALAYFYMHNKKRERVVFQSWALEPFYGHEASSQTGLKKLYVGWALQKPWKYCILNAEAVTADNESQIPNIVKLGVNKNKIEFIPLGIPFKNIRKLKNSFKNRRKECGFDKNDLVLLSVGQIITEKGIEEIIKGFILIKKKIKNAKLIMIGKGLLEEKMNRMIQEASLEKDFVHLKNVPEADLFDYHFSSDVFINGTHTNYPTISVQEALATGLPVVSGADLFLIKNGINGYKVGLNNPKGIAMAVIKMYKDKKVKQMGNNSIKTVESADYENVAKLAVEVYKKLLAQKK
ncbi:MAG: glycosyltransferase family 4 protein [Candidatus Pacearchaeota archaeon]|nr:glycosyltransferase family 4 protein [Candidatus Pacearchaeota archaeon]